MKLNVKEFIELEKEELFKTKESLGITSIPTIDILQIGDEYASNKYVGNKVNTGIGYGVDIRVHKYILDSNDYMYYNANDFSHIAPYSINEIIDTFDIIERPKMIQEPSGISHDRITIPDIYDVDGRQYKEHNKILPCTAQGVFDYLTYLFKDKGGLKGKSILIINRSELVGRPLLSLLLDNDAFVSVAHSKVPKETILNQVKNSDIIITGTGMYGFLTDKDIPSGATVIDVGITRNPYTKKMCGDLLVENDDVDFDYTPVPGGVGLLTVHTLLKNAINLHIEIHNKTKGGNYNEER